MTALEKGRSHLETLGLTQAAEMLDSRLDSARHRQLAYPEFLAELLGIEVQARRDRYLDHMVASCEGQLTCGRSIMLNAGTALLPLTRIGSPGVALARADTVPAAGVGAVIAPTKGVRERQAWSSRCCILQRAPYLDPVTDIFSGQWIKTPEHSVKTRAVVA